MQAVLIMNRLVVIGMMHRGLTLNLRKCALSPVQLYMHQEHLYGN